MQDHSEEQLATVDDRREAFKKKSTRKSVRYYPTRVDEISTACCRGIPHPRNWRTNLPESSLCTKRRSKALLMAGWTIIESVLELPSLNGCSQALNETPVAYLPETLAHLWAWTVADKLRPQWDFIQVRIN